MSAEHPGYTPPEVNPNATKDNNKDSHEDTTDLEPKKKNLERISKEQADDLIARLHSQEHPPQE